MRDYSNYNKQVNMMEWSAKKLFEVQLKGAEGFDVTIDGMPQKVIIQQHTNPMDEYKEDRKLICLNDVNIKRGSYILVDGEIFIVVTDIDKNTLYKDCKIRKTNNTITFLNSLNSKVTMPCVISNLTLYSDGLESNKYGVLPDGKRSVVIKSTEETKKLDIGHRFIFNNKKSSIFAISHIDDFSMEGLIQLTMIQSSYREGLDDLVNNIADNSKSTIVLDLQLDNKEITLGESYILQPKVTKDGVNINTDIIYTSDNPLVATVDENGVITVLAEGTGTITATLKDNIEIKDSILITVKSIPLADNYTINIDGLDTLKKLSTNTYTAQVFNNGIEDLTKIVTWSVSDLVKTTIISQDNNSLKLKGNDSTGEVIITASIEHEGNIIKANKTVILKGSW